MRWGVRDEATDDHMTTELCMKEIDNCQRLSMGPNFVVSIQFVIDISCFYSNVTIRFINLCKGLFSTKVRLSTHSYLHFGFRTGAIPRGFSLNG